MTSDRRLIGLRAPTFLSHSLTSARARARLIVGSEVRRCLSQLKPCRPIAHSSDGAEISNGERPSQTATLPAKTKRPERISAACVASAVRRSCGAITNRSFLPDVGSRLIQNAANWPSSARRIARARNRDSLACSVTEPRDIDAPLSCYAAAPPGATIPDALTPANYIGLCLDIFSTGGMGFSLQNASCSRHGQIRGDRGVPHRNRPFRPIV